ncbi:MAG: universal stress protein [Sedimentibacter sp.]
MKKILVPIDGSNASLIAAEKAVELARQNNSEIRFISVVEVMGAIRYGEDGIGYAIDYTNINRKLIKEQTNILDKAIDRFYSSSVSFEKKILIGKPKDS